MSHTSTDPAPKSILLATDFSENAGVAMNWAVNVAQGHGARLVILHVAPVTATSGLSLDIQDHIGRSLDAIAAPIGDAGVEVTTRWQAGRPWERIVSEAQKHDLVVIGARGHTPLQNFPLGSTADRVLRSSSAPVLTVHPEDLAFERPPRKVIVPTDFSASASQALAAALRFFGAMADGGLDVTLLYACAPVVEFTDMYTAIPPLNSHVADEAEVLEMLDRETARVRSDSIALTSVVRQGLPAAVITDEIESTGAELVAMGTHGHSGLARFMLGSVAERVVHRARCPVLTVGHASAGRGDEGDDIAVARSAESPA